MLKRSEAEKSMMYGFIKKILSTGVSEVKDEHEFSRRFHPDTKHAQHMCSSVILHLSIFLDSLENDQLIDNDIVDADHEHCVKRMIADFIHLYEEIYNSEYVGAVFSAHIIR